VSAHRSSRRVALLLAEINRTIATIEANGQVGSVAHQKLIAQKMELLGLGKNSKSPKLSSGDKPEPTKEPTFTPWSDDWMLPQGESVSIADKKSFEPLWQIQLRLLEVCEMFEERAHWTVGKNHYDTQRMRRPDGSWVTLAEMEQALDAKIATLGLNRELLDEFFEESASKHDEWRKLPFSERMNRFRGEGIHNG
jgi:hypothetical protein